MRTVRDEWNLECPHCESDEHLQVEIVTMADLSEEGTEPVGDQEWSDDSYMRCRNCHFDGCVRDFEIDPPNAEPSDAPIDQVPIKDTDEQQQPSGGSP